MRWNMLVPIVALAICGAGFAWSSTAGAKAVRSETLAQGSAGTKANASSEDASRSASSDRFAAEWKEVRAKYPNVAAAYLESLELLVDSSAIPIRASSVERIEGLSARLHAIGFRFLRCRIVCDPPREEPPPPPPMCPPCRKPQRAEELESYLKCMEERINCMTP